MKTPQTNKPQFKYMHTLDGKPAFYKEGEMIYFSMRGTYNAVILVDTLKQIHDNERNSDAWRAEKNMQKGQWEYGWVKVRV